jgi:hypothetical protein
VQPGGALAFFLGGFENKEDIPMRQQLQNVAFALSLLGLWGCGSDSPPDDTTPKSFTCGASELHSAFHDQCGAMDVQGEGACLCMSMGWAWDGSACVALADGFCKCVGNDCDKLAKTKEECVASHATCSSPKSFSCGNAALFEVVHVACPAMDVQGEGACLCMSMGWIWDGSACVRMKSGYCTCVGDDCDKLMKTEEECVANHSDCLQ